MITKYTMPRAINGGHTLQFSPDGKIQKVIKKGKPIGKGWVVSCSINGEQIKERITSKISADHQEIRTEALMENWLEMLEKGLHPKKKDDQKEFLDLNILPTLENKIEEYVKYSNQQATGHKNKTAVKTILGRLLDDYTHPTKEGDKWNIKNKNISDVTPADIEHILNQLIVNNVFAQSSLQNVKNKWSTFFKYFIKKREIEYNPIREISSTIRSNKHTVDIYEPFSNEHFPIIMDEIKKYPKFNIFCQFMYHTCARPTELRKLKVGSIQGDFIKFKANESKTKYKDEVFINSELRKIIDNMGLENADADDYLFSSNMYNKDVSTIYGSVICHKNHAVELMRTILESLNLYENTGYKLYSFKTTSNCHKLLDGWNLIEVQKLNRHSSVSTTEKYVKKLSKYVKLENKKSRSI